MMTIYYIFVDYVIKNLLNDEELRNIIKDEDRFNKCIKSIVLYYTREALDKKAINEYVNNFYFIEKSKRLFKILSIIEWLENELGIDRFNIINLKIKNIESLVKKMKEQIELFSWLSFQTSMNGQKKEINARIQKLNSEDRIKKFFIDIINQFDDFYNYDRKQVGNKKLIVYINFTFSEKIINAHSKIINCLNMDPDKFIEPMKSKIKKLITFDGADIKNIKCSIHYNHFWCVDKKT
jgi:hypothetical protein